MFYNLRSRFADALEWLLHRVDPDYKCELRRREYETQVLYDIATGKIKPEHAQSAAYAALY